MSDQERGIYRKYDVRRLNDPTGKHAECHYYVLDLVHDKHAAAALEAYAKSCAAEYPTLAVDLLHEAQQLRTILDYPASETDGTRDAATAAAAISTAQTYKALAEEAAAIAEAKNLQIECLRVVLAGISAKAGIDSDALVRLLRETEDDIQRLVRGPVQ